MFRREGRDEPLKGLLPPFVRIVREVLPVVGELQAILHRQEVLQREEVPDGAEHEAGLQIVADRLHHETDADAGEDGADEEVDRVVVAGRRDPIRGRSAPVPAPTLSGLIRLGRVREPLMGYDRADDHATADHPHPLRRVPWKTGPMETLDDAGVHDAQEHRVPERQGRFLEPHAVASSVVRGDPSSHDSSSDTDRVQQREHRRGGKNGDGKRDPEPD